MKTRLTSTLLATLLTFVAGAKSNAQTTAITYQGRLATNNTPANGRYDMQFVLFAVESGGSPSSNPILVPGIGVTNGLFTVALDFGWDAFNGISRWLDIAVSPAGSGVFTALTPRQLISPAPLALTAYSAFTALSVPGLDGYSLRSSDGSITNALFVDGRGEVGIGTTDPAARLHVVSAPSNALPPRIESSANTGFSAGVDFYHDGVGKGYVGVPDRFAGIAPAEMVLFGGPGVNTSLWGGGVRALTTDLLGNVQVSGDVKLGTFGQFRAASGDESLRIVRGMVGADGTILSRDYAVAKRVTVWK